MSNQTDFSQQGQRYQFDAIVIGSGIAGIRYALALLENNSKAKIALITKKDLLDCNSEYAQGGMAAVNLLDDSVEQHIQDTLKASDGLAKPEAVRTILNQAPHAIQELTQYGVKFDRGNSHFDLAQEGAHSFRRIYHVGDHTGDAVMQVLKTKLLEHPQIMVFENHIAINLISQNQFNAPNTQAEILGAYVLDEKQNKIHTFLANVTVLATGGAGKVYRYTTNQPVATGDGLAMAWRAGARVANCEFYQFHPTLLFHHEVFNFLISEALRGEGGRLINPITNERFMKRYAPEKMELASRDIVARAIFTEIENTNCHFVLLDMSHHKKDFLQKRFPTIFKTLMHLNIDMSKEPIPVVPGAHYLCGGILSDVNGATDLQRLYAIGETSCSGLHGANRLASNSLIEGFVMAEFAAKSSLKWLKKPIQYKQSIKDWISTDENNSQRASEILSHWYNLRNEMSTYAGIIRSGEGLKYLLKLIHMRKNIIDDYYWKHAITRHLIELRNIILVAELIVRSAICRKESRGGHYREDYAFKLKKTKDTILSSSKS